MAAVGLSCNSDQMLGVVTALSEMSLRERWPFLQFTSRNMFSPWVLLTCPEEPF